MMSLWILLGVLGISEESRNHAQFQEESGNQEQLQDAWNKWLNEWIKENLHGLLQWMKQNDEKKELSVDDAPLTYWIIKETLKKKNPDHFKKLWAQYESERKNKEELERKKLLEKHYNQLLEEIKKEQKRFVGWQDNIKNNDQDIHTILLKGIETINERFDGQPQETKEEVQNKDIEELSDAYKELLDEIKEIKDHFKE